SPQVLLHPTALRSVRVLSTTVGRDKVYRAVQNFARLYAWFLVSRGASKVDVAKWNALKSHLATARKLMRLGKPIEHLQAALRTALAPGPAAEQLTAVARQLAYFIYLSLDALAWAHSIKFTTFQPPTKIANRAWLAGILLSIVNAAIKTARLAKETKLLRHKQSEKDLGSEADRQVRLHAIATNRAAIRHQFIIDALDLWIPATALGLSNLNDGFVGLFGVISSVMALEKLWAAEKK
ncbi:peroxisomal biogenesis factor 11, partial [Mycena amicta]